MLDASSALDVWFSSSLQSVFSSSSHGLSKQNFNLLISNFPFLDYAFMVKSKNSAWLQVLKIFLHFFPPKHFIQFSALHSRLGSILCVCFKIRCEIQVGLFLSFFVYGCQLFQYYLLKSILPLLNQFCTFAKNQLGVFVWVYFCILSSILQIYMPTLF